MAKIVILGWGSLIWDKREDFERLHGPWQSDGPSLKIEFSRISSSRGGALTLVIDPQHGAISKVQHCLSVRGTLKEAVKDLRRRETTNPKHVGYFSRTESHARDPESLKSVAGWVDGAKVDAVVWSDLPSNFENQRKIPFSVPAAISYLNELNPAVRARALEYIKNAPAAVRTPLREAVEKQPGLVHRT
jgi:hypothetical protein